MKLFKTLTFLGLILIAPVAFSSGGGGSSKPTQGDVNQCYSLPLVPTGTIIGYITIRFYADGQNGCQNPDNKRASVNWKCYKINASGNNIGEEVSGSSTGSYNNHSQLVQQRNGNNFRCQVTSASWI